MPRRIKPNINGGVGGFGFTLAAAYLALILVAAASAFQSTPIATRRNRLRATIPTQAESISTTSSPVSTASPAVTPVSAAVTSSSFPQSSTSHVLTIDEMNPILKFEKNGKPKVLNLTGLYHLAVIVLSMPIWLAAMETLHWLGEKSKEKNQKNAEGINLFDPNRAKFDYSGKLWCRTYLAMTDCYPQIAGDVARLRSDGNEQRGACLFVANHASFLDIAVLCCVLDPVFKFIAKDSLKKFPGVGKQLVGGEHVLIDRTNKRSQLRTFKQAITYLKNGVPIMAFPEGARSPDGRLMSFKGGIFSMAIKANVPIVPLSLANTHAVMPSQGFLPVQSGKNKLRVFVHDEISVEGKTEEEISKEVKAALLSQLPLDQHPLEVDVGLEEEVE